MFRSEQDSNPGLCDTCTAATVIYHLCYKPNWRRVIMQIHDNPLKMDNICESHISIPRHSGQCCTSWAIRSTGSGSLCEFMVIRRRRRSMYYICGGSLIFELRSQTQGWCHHRHLVNGKRRPENFRPQLNFNFDLCEIHAVGRVLCQLSYQVNWELVIVCGHDNL